MVYKGKQIYAQVKSYERWTLDDDGALSEWYCSLDDIEVTGYDVQDGGYFDTLEEAKAAVDSGETVK